MSLVTSLLASPANISGGTISGASITNPAPLRLKLNTHTTTPVTLTQSQSGSVNYFAATGPQTIKLPANPNRTAGDFFWFFATLLPSTHTVDGNGGLIYINDTLVSTYNIAFGSSLCVVYTSAGVWAVMEQWSKDMTLTGQFKQTGTTFGALNKTPASQQTGGVATAGASYTATEQGMLQKAYDALRTFGFLS